jgi:3-methylfumaryl-CoA hydratase
MCVDGWHGIAAPMHVRLYAGGDIQYHDATFPHIGDRVTRTTTYHTPPVLKQSRHGPVIFVSLRHTWRYINEKKDAPSRLTDIQYFAYRSSEVPRVVNQEPPAASSGGASDAVAATVKRWSRPPQPIDDIMLFRYSALTFNSHRIHYVGILTYRLAFIDWACDWLIDWLIAIDNMTMK